MVRIRADRKFPDHPLHSLWESRDLILLLARRDVHLRYQYSVAGIGWAILQPLLTVLVLAGFQRVMGHTSSRELPYPLYVATALAPWTFFVHAIVQSAHCLLKHTSVITKVHFPKLVLPIAAVMAGSVDLVAGLALLPFFMLYYRIVPHLTILALPLFAVHAILLAAGVGIWLAFLNVRFRDTANALPFITQLWFFSTPIAYISEMLPPHWRFAAGFNPVMGILEGFRWSIFGSASPMLGTWVTVSWIITGVLLISGVVVFLSAEEDLADLI